YLRRKYQGTQADLTVTGAHWTGYRIAVQVRWQVKSACFLRNRGGAKQNGRPVEFHQAAV
ncbi:MAG: hypothetical protein ACOVT5_16390, partial [Armatimonadaceae bacterium]